MIKKRQGIKFLALLVAIAMAISLFPLTLAFAANDTNGHWAQYEIETWAEYGVIGGYPDGTFRPNDVITRGEFFKIVNSIFDFQQTASNPFTDLDTNAWYFDHVIKLYAAGIINGDGSAINAESFITRQEAFSILARLFEFDDNASALGAFSDSGNVAVWARGSVGALVSKGYVSGRGDALYPLENITRAEVVKVLDNIIEMFCNSPGTYTGDVSGVVIIASGGVVLEGMSISGDVYITEGAKNGSTTLNGVSVSGALYQNGAAKLTLADSTIKVLNISKDGTELLVDKNSEIDKLNIRSDNNKVLGDGTINAASVSAGDNNSITVDGTAVTVSENAGIVNKGTADEIGSGKSGIIGGGASNGSGSSGGGGGGGSSTPSSAFTAAKAVVLAAIADADIDLSELVGKTIVLPGQEILVQAQFPFFQEPIPAVLDPDAIVFTQWSADVGVPAITSAYGNAAASGIYELIETMLSHAAAGYDMATDPDFADFTAFEALYLDTAIAGTVVSTKTIFVASVAAASYRDSSGDTGFTSSQPYRIYDLSIEVGEGPLDALRVLDCIPTSSPFSLGPITYESIGSFVYEMGFNNEGIVIEYNRIPTDSVASYGDAAGGEIRIGHYANDIFEIAPGAAAYTYTSSAINATPIDANTLTEDWNDSIRVVLNDERQIIEAYISEAFGTGSAPANYSQIEKFEFIYGVKPDDPNFGYNGEENPYPVNFALYDPILDAANTSANDPDALYPLFIFLHGIGGGGNKNGLVNNDSGIGLRYIQADYQAEFETNTTGVNGAYVMLPRANETSSHVLGTQGWLHGFREDTNPLYAAGDASYKGRATHVAALIADIQWLVENRNIDPDRIYLTGFSAGGYMAWQTLLEGGDLFAAASPQGAAFFPEGGQFAADYSENELGLRDRILAVKDVPIWLIHARNDGTCAWDITIGDGYEDASSAINGEMSLWGSVRSLSDGSSAIQGSSLTRVTIHNYLKTGSGADAGQHSPMLMYYNNVYDGGLSVEGTTLTFFDVIYDSMPVGYNEASPTTADRATLYAHGINPSYSTPTSWGDTFISWLNTCGDAKANG